MHCEPISFEDRAGQTLHGWICGGRSSSSCGEKGCRRKATALCDFPLERGARPRTCDRGMCSDHRRPQPRLGPEKDYCGMHHDIALRIARSVVLGLGGRW